MTLDEILSHPYSRRVALSLIVCFILLLETVRYFYVPTLDSALHLTFAQGFAKFLEDLATSLLTTIFLSLAVLFLAPRSENRAKILVLDASDLKPEFSEGLNKSENWWFYGGCGRYFRSAVLGKMDVRATSESTHKYLHAIILNPGNPQLCIQHAEYRSATSQGRRDGNWSPSRVKCELLATIALCLRAAQRNRLLEVKLYLTERFSTFRADISDFSAIETREDPKAPALKSPVNSDFYKALRTEFSVLMRQSKEIKDESGAFRDIIDRTSLERAIESLHLPGLSVTAQEYDQIWETINNPKNPHD